MNHKEQKTKQETLESLIVILSPFQHQLSKTPLIGRIYLKAYESLLKNKLSHYQNFIFK